ncbi:AN1-type zinc finger protein 1 [Microbotryomycetes sp. JL221]|nr:AN1-type zinc finger protein 1 [Microbotryomycetes sp. JL221]
MEDRLYLTVELRQGDELAGRSEREFYLAKTLTAGRALDLFAKSFGVTNANNTSLDPSKLLVLVSDTEPQAPIDNSAQLGAVVENGGRILLCRGSSSKV